MTEIHDTVSIVVERDNKFLVIKKSKHKADAGDLAFPGGHVDKGESAFESASREASEEVGEVEILEKKPFIIFVHDVIKALNGFHKHNCHAFRGKVAGKLTAGDDACEILWMKKEEILKNPKVQNFTKMILRGCF